MAGGPWPFLACQRKEQAAGGRAGSGAARGGPGGPCKSGVRRLDAHITHTHHRQAQSGKDVPRKYSRMCTAAGDAASAWLPEYQLELRSPPPPHQARPPPPPPFPTCWNELSSKVLNLKPLPP